MNNATLSRLAAMPPHKQAGYLANPLLEFMLERCVAEIQNPTPMVTPEHNIKVNNKNNKNNKNNTINNEPLKLEPKPIPKPEPEPIIEIEDEPIIDIFG